MSGCVHATDMEMEIDEDSGAPVRLELRISSLELRIKALCSTTTIFTSKKFKILVVVTRMKDALRSRKNFILQDTKEDAFLSCRSQGIGTAETWSVLFLVCSPNDSRAFCLPAIWLLGQEGHRDPLQSRRSQSRLSTLRSRSFVTSITCCFSRSGDVNLWLGRAKNN